MSICGGIVSMKMSETCNNNLSLSETKKKADVTVTVSVAKRTPKSILYRGNLNSYPLL